MTTASQTTHEKTLQLGKKIKTFFSEMPEQCLISTFAGSWIGVVSSSALSMMLTFPLLATCPISIQLGVGLALMFASSLVGAMVGGLLAYSLYSAINWLTSTCQDNTASLNFQ